ncbi:hypothetical protein CLV24_10918 [Pontibacter ummariensis]|uniref:Uncharacterized protein n=2 Tax=Pontibacter ummariensis TaxID=1610492 RepID=A0A239FY47_9BACT|nr:hypothetical protein CLV24_10918 [Pontibacter ummariensis]SNS61182.1 hypothetical protein SAMN06296052_109152 [Pontibacter ummariensis]
MSYEDLFNNRIFNDFRQIRNVFLAHKQENSFIQAYSTSDSITDNKIQDLLKFMKENLSDPNNYLTFNELIDQSIKTDLENLSKQILSLFHEEFYEGFRISNNFLCTGNGQIKEMSSSALSGVFYRYNSSKELSTLANYFISNLIKDPKFENALINFKIDYLLHAVNMYDCIYKDTKNNHSIDGLLEVMQETGMGDTSYLDNLKTDSGHIQIYKSMRQIRNKLAGHMDTKKPLAYHLQKAKDFDISIAYDFVNELDKAVYDAGETHVAIQSNYFNFNLKLDSPDITGMEDFANQNYFD